MTVEADERNGVSEVEECEGKTELNLDSHDGLPKLVGECNGTVVHEKIDEIDGNAKDDGDGSYVFVDGADTVSDDLTEGGLDTTTTEHVVVADHSESLQGEAIHEDKGLSKLIADSPTETEGKQVQANELRVEEGLNSASLDFEDNVVSSSEHDLAVEASESITNEDKVEQTGKVEGKNDLDSAGIVEGNQESLTSGSEAAVSELHQPDVDEGKVEEKNKLEAVEDADADEESEIVVTEAVVSELHQLNTEEKVEDNNKLEAAENVEGNQESQIRSMETVEPEPHQLATREEETTEPVDEIRAENVEGNQESQTRITKTVEPEPHQLAASEEETTEPSDDSRLEDNNKIEAAENVEGNQESQIRFTETVEPEPHQLAAKEEETTEPADDIRLEEPSAIDNVTVADEVHGEEPSVIDDIDSKLNHLNSGEVEIEDESNLNSAQEAEVNQDSQLTSVGATELELHQFDNEEEKVEGENKLHSAANAEEEQQSHMLVAEAVDFDLHELNEGEKESEKLVNEALVEKHSANLGPDPELNLETAVSVVDGTQLDSNSTNITDESRESVPPCTVELDITGMEVVNNSDEGHKNMSTCDTGDVVSESVHVNGAVDNSKSLSCPVDDLQSEKDVENVALENGDSILTDPTVALENGDSIPTDSTYCIVPESEVGNGSFECKSIPTCLVDDVKSEAEYTKPSAETGNNTHAEIERGETISSYSLDNTHAAIEFENGSVESGERMSPCSVEDVKSEAGISDKAIEIDQGIPPTIPVEVAEIESSAINNCIEIGSSLHTCPIENGDTESDAGNCSGTSLKDIPNEDNLKSESGVQNGFAISFGSMPNCVNSAIDVETEGVRSISGDGKPIREEVEGVVNHGSRPSSPEDPTIGALEGQKVNQEVGRRPFRYLIRIPRYGDDKSREEVRLAQLQVDEKTRNRDAIRATIQSRRAISNDHRDKFEAARSEERAARDALHAKRQELDSVQSVLNKMKNATSIEEIDDRIHSMEHMIEHETMPLKEEKQLIREIKQLKNLREQLCLSLGRQAEEQLTMDQRDKIEERFKILKRELDSTRSEVLRTEGITKAAKKIYFGESDEIKELQAQFRAADDLRQEAYTHLQNLRKQFYEKNKYFRMYKEDLKKAEDLASSGDKEELQRLCVGQVETIMELWNKNDEFRNEYIRCNTLSTLRRLRTLDGRSLGPDEEPPIIRSFLNEKVDNTFAASSMMGSEQARSVESVGPNKTEVKSLINLEQKNPKMDMRSVVHLERKDSKAGLNSVVHLEEKNPAAKSNKAVKPAASKTDSVTASGEEEAKEENKQTEEEELSRKAEELRKEEATAKLKEQRRLEEKAKAKEAEERKRRNAEKAQARAELRAQKEAELKEKEKERRARKKERKVAAAAALSEGTGEAVEGESTPSSEAIVPESIQEAEIKEKSTTVVKRSQKPPVKQTKVKTIPPPLRNRGKRRMQPWMWVLLVVLVIIAFFLVGNSGYPSKFGMPNFRF